jgi:hypothetical protein
LGERRETVGAEVTLITAVAVLEESAELVAVTVTEVWEVIVPGVVYRPAALIVPAVAGVMDHVTAVFAAPVTFTVNCWLCPRVKVLVAGLIEMATGGLKVIVAIAVLLVSAALVALTVTVCGEFRICGAVYKPDASIEPTPVGLMDQITLVLELPVTALENWCV